MGQIAEAKESVVSLEVVEKVSRILDVLRYTSHNGLPVIDGGSGSEGKVKSDTWVGSEVAPDHNFT